MDDSKIWRLNITTFRGIAPGAQHSYGVVQAPGSYVEKEGKTYHLDGATWNVNRIMTAEQAARLNTLNERFGRGYSLDNAAGDASQQFDSDTEIEEHGVAVWNLVCTDPGAILLVSSGFGDAGPAKPLGGPEEVVSVLAEIWALDESETSNDWTEIRERASREWDEAIERFGLKATNPPRTTYGGSNAPEGPGSTAAYTSVGPDGAVSASLTYDWHAKRMRRAQVAQDNEG